MARDAEGWHWMLWSGNGRMMARNAIPYDSEKHCIQAVKLVAEVARGAKLITRMHGGRSARDQ